MAALGNYQILRRFFSWASQLILEKVFPASSLLWRENFLLIMSKAPIWSSYPHAIRLWQHATPQAGDSDVTWSVLVQCEYLRMGAVSSMSL
jgi:hypothetical protein